MKKSIVFLICIIAALTFGALCAYADDAEDDALTVTITAADGLEIPQEGLAVTVYAGNRRSWGGGAANSITWEPSYYYSYEHYARANGKETNWITKKRLSDLYNETVYIDPETRSATATIYPKSNVSYAAIMTDGSGAYVRGYGSSDSYYITLPASCNEYILNLAEYGDLRGVYYTENGFTKDISEADPISAAETEKTVILDRYEPDLPVTYIVSQREDNPNIYEVNYTNESDFDIKNVIVYTYTEYSDGEVFIERDRPRNLRKKAYTHNEISGISQIDKMYMFIWDENMRPLSEKIVVKDNTVER